MSAVRVVLVEDHALVRAGLRTVARGRRDRRSSPRRPTGSPGSTSVLERRPDVAVIDLGLPGMDGIALTRALKAHAGAPRVVILTMHELDDEVLAALAAGADAYCVKSSDPGVVHRRGARGRRRRRPTSTRASRTWCCGGSAARRRAAETSPLTPRETEILRLIADGAGNAEIAEQLHVGLGTVKGHIADILEKLAASDRAQAAVTAYRRGLIRDRGLLFAVVVVEGFGADHPALG